MKVRVITITLSPALPLSGCEEIVFLFDKDGRWAVTQEFTVCFFLSGHCYKAVGWRPNHGGSFMADTLWNEIAHILCYFPPFFPQEYVAYSHTGRIIPAIWFRYDLSPITVKYTERRQPLYRFITSVSCPKLSFSLPLPAFHVPPETFLSRGVEFLPQGVVELKQHITGVVLKWEVSPVLWQLDLIVGHKKKGN